MTATGHRWTPPTPPNTHTYTHTPHTHEHTHMMPPMRSFDVSFVLNLNFPNSKVHEANMGPSGADRTQVGPMLATWTLLSGLLLKKRVEFPGIWDAITLMGHHATQLIATHLSWKESLYYGKIHVIHDMILTGTIWAIFSLYSNNRKHRCILLEQVG